MEKSHQTPVFVMESLPFGLEGDETQPLAPQELELLAGSFEAEEIEVPSAPVVTRFI